MDNRLLNSQATKLASWLKGCGYLSLYEWGKDSDYRQEGGIWYNEDNDEVNIFECAWFAMEAANEGL